MNRKRWLRLHKNYERKAYSILRNSFRNQVNKIDLNLLNEGNYKGLIDIGITYGETFEAFRKIYEEIGNRHGKEIGRELQETKNFNLDLFSEQFQRTLINWLTNNAGQNIISVNRTLADEIIQRIIQGYEDNLSNFEIVQELERWFNDKDFYSNQLLRIIRTETTSAANYGAMVAAQSSNLQLKKRWISTVDSRTRKRPQNEFDHLLMDGVEVNQGENFNVNNDLILFPGDPKGQPANIIQCRCTVAYIPQRDPITGLILRK